MGQGRGKRHPAALLTSVVFEASLSWKEKGVRAGLIQAQIQAPQLRLKSHDLAEPQFPNL